MENWMPVSRPNLSSALRTATTEKKVEEVGRKARGEEEEAEEEAATTAGATEARVEEKRGTNPRCPRAVLLRRQMANPYVMGITALAPGAVRKTAPLCMCAASVLADIQCMHVMERKNGSRRHLRERPRVRAD